MILLNVSIMDPISTGFISVSSPPPSTYLPLIFSTSPLWKEISGREKKKKRNTLQFKKEEKKDEEKGDKEIEQKEENREIYNKI